MTDRQLLEDAARAVMARHERETAGRMCSEWVEVARLRETLATLDSKPATEQAFGWTGNPDADLALILLDRLDDTGEGNADRIEQLDGIVRKLATTGQASSDFVPMPENEDQAAGFALVGEAWLRQHTPHRLRATQPARAPLTEEQIDAICDRLECWSGFGLGATFNHRSFARAIERAHGIGEAGNA